MAKNQHWQTFISLPPLVRHRDALPAIRIAISVGLPLLIMLIAGQPRLTIFTAFGAFAALYGRNQPLVARILQQSAAGLMLIFCVGVGLLVSSAGIAGWGLVVITAIASAICAHFAMMINLKPGGPLFFVFASAGIASVPYNGKPLLDMTLTISSAIFSVLLGIVLGQLWGDGRNVTPNLRSDMSQKHMLMQSLTNMITMIVAGIVANLIGLSHAYWAMVAAASILAAPNTYMRVMRGAQRSIGTVLGVFVTAFFVSMHPEPWHVAVLVVVAQYVTELFVLRNYGVAAIFITPLALFMVHLASPFTSYEIVTTRLIETVLGAAIGILGAFVSPSPEFIGQNTTAIPVVRVARNWKR